VRILISEQLVKNPYGGIILYGKDGTGVVDDALDLGAAIANYGSPKKLEYEEHPNCHFIDILPGKREITLDQIEEIKKVQNIVPMYSRVNVFVIAHADRMSETVQNALLKALEDGSRINCFLLCCETRLLPTIMNRCCALHAGHDISEECIRAKADELKLPIWAISELANGREEWLSNKDFPKVCRMIADMGMIKERREVLFCLDALCEKNENSFVKTTDETMVYALFEALESVFLKIVGFDNGFYNGILPLSFIKLYSGADNIGILKALEEAKSLVKRKLLTFNDYFNVIRLLAV